MLIVALLLGPYIYNYHLFSLAQLKNSIEVGDDYDVVAKNFEQYQKEHDNGSGLQVSIESSHLFIYHVNIFDDCQLTVNFDKNNKVKSVVYVGD